jgi:hypothetical protein
MRQVLHRLLSADPSERPAAGDILAKSLFTGQQATMVGQLASNLGRIDSALHRLESKVDALQESMDLVGDSVRGIRDAILSGGQDLGTSLADLSGRSQAVEGVSDSAMAASDRLISRTAVSEQEVTGLVTSRMDALRSALLSTPRGSQGGNAAWAGVVEQLERQRVILLEQAQAAARDRGELLSVLAGLKASVAGTREQLRGVVEEVRSSKQGTEELLVQSRRQTGMLSLIIQNEHQIPKLIIIIPRNNYGVASTAPGRWPIFDSTSFLKNKQIIQFVCPVCLTIPNTQGYEVALSSDWAVKYGPALKLTIVVISTALRAAKAAGYPVPIVGDLVEGLDRELTSTLGPASKLIES